MRLCAGFAARLFFRCAQKETGSERLKGHKAQFTKPPRLRAAKSLVRFFCKVLLSLPNGSLMTG
jgi:hypothetical protein